MFIYAIFTKIKDNNCGNVQNLNKNIDKSRKADYTENRTKIQQLFRKEKARWMISRCGYPELKNHSPE